jgi:hypothetical protein
MIKLALGAIGLSCALLAVPAAASAQTLGPDPAAPAPSATVTTTTPGIGPGGFGAANQVVIGTDLTVAFNHTGEKDESTFSLAPALDYFLMPQFSVGGQVRLDFIKDGPFSNTVLGLGPRAGYMVPLGSMFSLFPRAGIYYQHVTTSNTVGTMTTSGSYNLFSFFVFAPFNFHPVPHFFVGLGPHFTADFAGANEQIRAVTFGLSSTVGGWFDWL